MATLDLKVWFRDNMKPYLTTIKSAIATAKTAAETTAKNYTDQEVAALAATVGSITGSYKGSFTTLADMNAVTAKNGDWAILSVDDVANESGIYVKQTGGFVFVVDIVAFDELRTEILASDAEFATGTSTTKTGTVKQIKDALALINSVIGSLSSLTTTDKSSIVNAINEVKGTAVIATGTTVNQDWVDGITTQDPSKFDSATNDSKVTTVGYLRMVFGTIANQFSSVYGSINLKADKGGSGTQTFLVADANSGTQEAVSANQFNFTITQTEANSDWTAA
jgi:hypothetical protein